MVPIGWELEGLSLVGRSRFGFRIVFFFPDPDEREVKIDIVSFCVHGASLRVG